MKEQNYSYEGGIEDPSSTGRSDKDKPCVKAALLMMSKNMDTKIIRDGRNLLIQQLMEEGFEVADPTGNKKISPQMLQQALWRTANRMKPLDFMIHGTGKPEWLEKVVTDGVTTVMDKGGFLRGLRDKDGTFQKLLLYGDGFLHIGTDPDDDQDIPIVFNPISNTNIYVDSYSTSIRAGGWGRSATQMCVIFSYSWDQACEMWPELEKNGGKGRIPRDTGLLKELERSYIQTVKLDDLVEVAYFYDIANETYCVFAGSQCTLLEEFKDDEYPFIKDGKPYIPIIQFMCLPSSEGFWNYGIGNMLYKLALISKRLLNMGVGHVEDSTYPITLVNVPQSEAAKFFNKLQAAHEMRASGKKGYVAMEYSPNNPGASRVDAQSLITQNLITEWQIVFERLDNEIRRLGINLDDIQRGPDTTATQILSEEENASAFVKQIQEYNASEMQFAVEVTLDFIKHFVKPTNDTLLEMTTKIEAKDIMEDNTLKGQVRADFVTLGMVAKELKQNDYFVRINARSGAIPSNVMQQAQVVRLLNVTPQGTPAYYRLMNEYAKLNDRDISLDDFQAAMPQPGMDPNQPSGGEQAGGQQFKGPSFMAGSSKKGMGPLPTETDRLSINPRLAEPTMAL